MSRILINNSYSQLVQFKDSDLLLVRNKLTYTDESIIMQKQMLHSQMRRAKGKFLYVLKAKFKALGSETVCWLDDNNKFPTGLLHIVKEVLKSAVYVLDDKRVRPEPYNLFRWNNTPHALRYYQKEAIEAFISKGRGVISSAVGSGKTAMATAIIKELGVNTLFIVPSSALLTQAYDVFCNAFGSKHVEKLSTITVKKKNAKRKPIRVVTIQTLASLSKQGLIQNALGGVDFVINDEAHHGGSFSYTSILNSMEGIYFRLGLSGTYIRNDSKTLDLWGVSGEVVYDYPASRATAEGYLTPAEFNIIPVIGKHNKNYQAEYKDNYGGLALLEGVCNLVKNTIPKDKQILILVDRKEGVGHLIKEYLKEQGISCTYVTGDNSKDEIKDAIEAFNDKTERILLASTVLGEGVDIRSTEALILCRGGKSEVSIVQAIGRAVRLYPGKTTAQIYDFNFKFCKYLPRHLALRIEMYQRQFAGKINNE